MAIDEHVQRLDGQPVVVTTASGRAVSLGRFKVTAGDQAGSASRVDVVFETDRMCCTLGVPSSRWAEVLGSQQVDVFRYALPAGDSVWLPKEEALPAASAGGDPVVMGFPVPTEQIAPVPLIGPLRGAKTKEQ